MALIKVWVTARNVVNTDEIRTKLKTISDRAVYQGGKQWVLRNVYNYLINDFDNRNGVQLVRDESGLKAVFKSISKIPKWALDVLKNNNELYIIEPARTFWTRLNHTVDYLNTQDRDWSRISFPQMEKLVKDWDEELKKQKQGKVNKDDYKHLFNSGQYQWVEIRTSKGLKDEGSKMGHCVGGEDYCRNRQRGKIKIFSLRERDFDKPHVTIEVDRQGRVVQIQGKQNKPQPKYASNVADFLNKTKYEAHPEEVHDWGLVQYLNNLVPIDDLPKNITFNIEFVQLEHSSGMRNTIPSNVIKNRNIHLPETEHCHLSVLSALSASFISVPNGTIHLWVPPKFNLSRVLKNLQSYAINLSPSCYAQELPSDLRQFDIVHLGGYKLDAGNCWVIPNNLKCNRISTYNPETLEALKEKGVNPIFGYLNREESRIS